MSSCKPTLPDGSAIHPMIECVINVSEGRRKQTVAAIRNAIESTPDAFLLDVHQDWDHHRAVFSFIGNASSVFEAASSAVSEAIGRIDLRSHQGVHPRLGAVDVVPFVPLQGISMQACVARARRFGEKVSRAFDIPIFLYEKAASTPGHESLPKIRRKGSEEVLLRPDFGPSRLHPTAGAVVIGVRSHLIAFNVFLDSTDGGAAREVAARVRASSGGLSGLRALGFFLVKRNQAQVSMNLTDYGRTSLGKVFRRVEQEAHRLGLAVASTEVVGLVPRTSMARVDVKTLRLENRNDFILENRIQEALLQHKESNRLV